VLDLQGAVLDLSGAVVSAGRHPGVNGDSMKKARRPSSNGMRSEYDFAAMKGGVRGKYVRRLRSGSNLVLLEPELASAFPSDAAVNQALRAALDVARVVSKRKRLPNRVQRTRAEGRVGKRRKIAGARR